MAKNLSQKNVFFCKEKKAKTNHYLGGFTVRIEENKRVVIDKVSSKRIFYLYLSLLWMVIVGRRILAKLKVQQQKSASLNVS